MFEKAQIALAIMQTCAALLDEVNRDSQLTLTIDNDVIDGLAQPPDYRFPTRVVIGRTVTVSVLYKELRSVEGTENANPNHPD